MVALNPQKQLDNLINDLIKKGRVPSLLLHSCCAPCSTYCIEYLSEYFNITVFYYNPNIFPEDEYNFRKKEQKRFIEEYSAKYPVKYIEGDYDPNRFYKVVSGFENEPEGGLRCERCFKLRLGETARKAKEIHADYFATTLTISPLKNAGKINSIGESLAKTIDVIYLPTDFKKKNGYLRSTQISKEFGMYRQDFCGCEFSTKAGHEESVQ